MTLLRVATRNFMKPFKFTLFRVQFLLCCLELLLTIFFLYSMFCTGHLRNFLRRITKKWQLAKWRNMYKGAIKIDGTTWTQMKHKKRFFLFFSFFVVLLVLGSFLLFHVPKVSNFRWILLSAWVFLSHFQHEQTTSALC